MEEEIQSTYTGFDKLWENGLSERIEKIKDSISVPVPDEKSANKVKRKYGGVSPISSTTYQHTNEYKDSIYDTAPSVVPTILSREKVHIVPEENHDRVNNNIFLFEAIEMFSPDIKEFFELSMNRRVNVFEKISSLSYFLDMIIAWDSIPAPLNHSFWSNTSKEFYETKIDSNSINKLEMSINIALIKHDLSMLDFINKNYGERTGL